MMKEELTGKPAHQYWHHSGMRRQSQCQYWCAGKHKNFQGGFSTLEMLIAFAVITLSITAVILVSFGNQSVTIDTELANEALYLAEGELENAHADTIVDFTAVDSTATSTIAGGPFSKLLFVSYNSECSKVVTSKVFWDRGIRENLSSVLTSVFTSQEISNNLGGDCDTEGSNSSWDAPTSYDNPDIIHPGSKATDVDVIKNSKGKFAFLTSEKNGLKGTFWVVDVTDPDNINDIGEYYTGESLYAIDVFSSGDLVYAFVASASTTAQLQVMKVDFSSFPGSNPVITRIAAEQLPGVSGSQPEGRSIFYNDEMVYVGTRETIGNEFHIFDVSTPSAPSPKGRVELNHSVSDIVVQGNKAYIAASAQTLNGCELIVIDVSNPTTLSNTCFPGSTDGLMAFRAPGNFDGTSIEVLGSKAYLGREKTSGDNDFYILNISDLSNITSLGSVDLDLNPGKEVVGLEVRGELAFIATTDTTPKNGGGPFLVYNIFDPSAIFLVSTCLLNFSEKSTGMDFMDNIVYVSNESQNALRIIYPSPLCS